MSTQEERGARFRALHEGEPFVIPNPWDAGSARVLAKLGFKALASTSSGFAFTLGRLDGNVTLDEVADHAAALDRATDLPGLVARRVDGAPLLDHEHLGVLVAVQARAAPGIEVDEDDREVDPADLRALEADGAGALAGRQVGDVDDVHALTASHAPLVR